MNPLPEERPVSYDLTRRRLLAVGLTAAVYGIFHRQIHDLFLPTTQKLVRHLRTLDIPSAERVEVVIDDPDATHVLVHILQLHIGITGDRGRRDTVQCQQEIATILGNLMDDPVLRLNHVYMEGLLDQETPEHFIESLMPMPGNPAEDKQLLRLLESQLGDLRRSLEKLPLTAEERSEFMRQKANLEQSSKETRHRLTQDYRALHQAQRQQTRADILRLNAVLRLHQERGLAVLPADRRELVEAAGRALGKIGLEQNPALHHRIFDDREDALIEKIKLDPNPVCVTVFGSSHEWKDNLEGKGKRVSLVEISPLTVAKRIRAEGRSIDLPSARH